MTVESHLNNNRLVAVCPESLNKPAESLLAKFAELDARGPRLQPGSIIDFGWAPLRIEAIGDAWFVCEPDFAHDAEGFVPTVAVTLQVLDGQARVIRQLRVNSHVTRFDQTVLIDERAWQAPRVVIDRITTKIPRDSGWHVMPAGTEAPDQPSQSKPINAGKLATLRPEWMKVFALPPGYLTVFDQSHLAEVYDDKSHRIASYKRQSDG
jgi:hypothetical protein